jgi:hypothetical protein
VSEFAVFLGAVSAFLCVSAVKSYKKHTAESERNAEITQRLEIRTLLADVRGLTAYYFC